jgi:hypothetical protein
MAGSTPRHWLACEPGPGTHVCIDIRIPISIARAFGPPTPMGGYGKGPGRPRPLTPEISTHLKQCLSEVEAALPAPIRHLAESDNNVQAEFIGEQRTHHTERPPWKGAVILGWEECAKLVHYHDERTPRYKSVTDPTSSGSVADFPPMLCATHIVKQDKKHGGFTWPLALFRFVVVDD